MSATRSDRGRRRTRRLATAVVLGLLVGGSMLLATSSEAAVQLQLAPGTLRSAATGVPAPEEGAPISVGAETVLCLSRPGAATVVEVSGEEASENFSVQAFSLRPHPPTGGAQLGDVRGTLAEAGFIPGRHRVDASCQGGAGYELGIRLARTGAGPARSRAFLVRWVSDTGSGTARIPLAMVLCDAPTAYPARCDAGSLTG